MNSVASTLNRVTGMEFNNQISVLTPNNWNTWKHDMQVLLMHYGCWQFIMQTKPEQPDEEATYKEKLDLQLRKDRCYTLIYTNISSDLKNLITETTDGVAAWKILKDHFEPVTRARVIQLLDQFFGTKYQPGEDVGIFISRVKTAATRLQEAGHKLDDLYIGFQLIRWLPQEFQSTVQQIYRWKEEDFRVVKIEAELILEANRLHLMKQDLEKAENAYLSSFTSRSRRRYLVLRLQLMEIQMARMITKREVVRFCEAECSLLELDKQLVTSCILVEENSDKGVWVIDTAATSHFCNDKSLFLDLKPITNMKMSLATEDKSFPVEGIGTLRFRTKVNSNLGYNLNLPDYYDDEDDFDRVKDSLTSRLVSKTSTETPSTSEKPEISSDNHNLIPCTDPIKDNTESQGFSDLSEQQEAFMVEVTIPNCYKQAIRSRDASKWRDAMDKEINVMKERKVWDLVDHPDNIKILENRWVYTIKYDENNKIVRYKARLVARGNTQLRGESFDEFTCRNCGGGDRGRVAIYRPFGEVSLSLNRTVTCMVLKANDRRTSCPCHNEFRGPRSDYVRQVALATTTQHN
ncbi:retrovirus-related Pol polyprotein from transposon TNT 1-94 [Trichonephila clavipes]|nr:retrovirus-related Pol polyprotein from transposon TNT 1-94 [Trichonephila clavipes]